MIFISLIKNRDRTKSRNRMGKDLKIKNLFNLTRNCFLIHHQRFTNEDLNLWGIHRSEQPFGPDSLFWHSDSILERVKTTLLIYN